MNIAHINRNNKDVQKLEEHLIETAELAASYATKFGFSDWGYIAGLWHDIGKYSKEFQKKMNEILISGDSSIRVDHSTYGAKKCVDEYSQIGKILSYCIAGHHAGLANATGGESSLRERLKKSVPNVFNVPDELNKRKEIDANLLKQWFEKDAKIKPMRYSFGLSFFIRMLFSCLVDADYLNTEKFMSPEIFQIRSKYPSIKELKLRFKNSMENFKKNKEKEGIEINSLRNRIYKECLKASELEPGLFSLTVPTGGGKTLSSLAFGLYHAAKYNLDRVIYVIPYTSIIEQNAQVFRNFLGNYAIVEHHSNYVNDDYGEEYRAALLATENWDAPLIVTTNVQFFESLFACRSSRVRKLHNITKSIIIFDEVQMIPADFLMPCIEAIREITRHYGASAVLCTATQPALEIREGFEGLENVREIISDTDVLYNRLKRIKEEYIGEIDIEKLAQRMEDEKQVLSIVNSRSEARDLYNALINISDDKDSIFHLSGLMCPVHRTVILETIRTRLGKGLSCRVISTQIIEAGVDIDFPVVYRSLAGIDSLAQAGGRCNREGKLKYGKLYVYKPSKGIPAICDFRPRAEEAETIISKNKNEFFSLQSIRSFFEAYFWRKGDALDKQGILKDLMEGIVTLDFPFRSIAEKFKIIRDTQVAVIVPYDGTAKALIRELRDYIAVGILRELQRYTIQVPEGVVHELSEYGYLECVHNEYRIINEQCYHQVYSNKLGLSQDTYDFIKADNTVF